MNPTDDRNSRPSRAAKCSSSSSGETCGCSSQGASHNVPRREFLKIAGVGTVGAMLGGQRSIMAGGFSAADLHGERLVPADKKLDASWVRALFERGTKEVYDGKALDNIGMPCGGIGSGQLYLCGDGTLGSWQIFNYAASNWVGDTHATYSHHGFAKPVEQGFAVAVRTGEEKPTVKKLSREGFKDITFNGQYPIGTVRYQEEGVPVCVTMEAFSPFIPLNAQDSGLPATLFHITLENRSDRPIYTCVIGWLENAVCQRSGAQLVGQKVTRIVRDGDRGYILHRAQEDKEALKSHQKPRPTVVFEDFESDNYDGWTVTGDAFGTKPAGGTLPGQQTVSGFDGKGLINSFLGGDAPTGAMTSRRFTINRRFVNLKVGGGGHPEKTCVSLKVDGKTVRTARGGNTEKLRWISWPVLPLEGKEACIEITDQ